MAASSQYHRGAAAPHSHYHALPGNHEHLCTDLATSWNSSSTVGLSRAPAPSALLQRFSSPAHRPPAHYLDYSGPSEYASANSPSQPQWPANYTRPASPGWNAGFSENSFASRSLSYIEAEGRLPVPHVNPRPSRQYKDTSIVPPNSSDHAYPPQEDHDEPQVAAHLGVAPNAPPFSPDAPTLAPHLKYANPDLTPTHASSQAAVTWAPQSRSHLSPVAPQHAFSHTGHALPPDVVMGGHGPLPGTAWAMVSSGASNPAPAVYEQLPEAAPLWPIEPDPANIGHVQHVLPDLALDSPPVARGRRSQTKKATAKVPAAFLERQPKSKVSKRRGPLDEEGRRKTHMMRREKKSCIRCRFYKSGCDEGDPCQKCQKVDGGARSFTQPCCRDRLEDTMLVRHCNGRSNQKEGEFIGYDWIPDWDLRGMDLIWNLPGTGPIHVRPMRITIGQYRPKRALLDAATNEWCTTEGRVVVEQPPYAVYDTQSLVSQFERYFSNIQPAVEQWIFSRVSHDEIALLTYQEVVRLRSSQVPGPNNLLDLCMRIQCLSIVSQGYGTVWSNDVPGIQEYDYSKMGRSQYEAYDRTSRDRPLPGAISQQMDVAALKLLRKLETDCHKAVSTRIFKPKIKPWYELYLALYVLFWNMEYIHRSAETYILSKNGTTVESHVHNVVNGQLRKWEYSFTVLIYYWKMVLRDFYPFKLARENPEELRVKGHIDSEGFEYVMKMTSIVDRIGGIGQSTAPHAGLRSAHNSLSSGWIKALLQEAGI